MLPPDISEALLACHGSLYRFARSLCREPFLAEDLVQETYRRALAASNRPARADQENVRPWMFTIMRHIWQNEIRHRSHNPLNGPMEGFPGSTEPETPDGVLTRKMIRSEIRHALEALPEIYREVIVLRELECLSYAEIAQVIHCPTGTVMSRLARGRALLRQLLTGLDVTVREVAR